MDNPTDEGMVRVSFKMPANDGQIFSQYALNGVIGKEISVTFESMFAVLVGADKNQKLRGTLIAAEVMDNGEAAWITMDVAKESQG
jgi:hypothetical protein